MKKITDMITGIKRHRHRPVPDVIEERFQLCMSEVAAGPDRAFEKGVSCH